MRKLTFLALILVLGFGPSIAKADIVGSEAVRALHNMYYMVNGANNIVESQCYAPNYYSREANEQAYRLSRRMTDHFRDALSRYISTGTIGNDQFQRVANVVRDIYNNVAGTVRYSGTGTITTICAATDDLPVKAVQKALEASRYWQIISN